MSNLFNKAYKVLIEHEGGYGFDPDDNGGETYKGIAKNFNMNWEGWELIYIAIDKLRLRGIKKLTNTIITEELDSNKELSKLVEKFYYNKYWRPLRLNRIYDNTLVLALFDKGVNMGIRQTVKLLQRALNTLGSKLIEDRFLGNATIKEINKYSRYKGIVLKSYKGELYGFYKMLRNRNKKYVKFIKGWIRRI